MHAPARMTSFEVGSDRFERVSDNIFFDRGVEVKLLGESNRADVDTETFIDVGADPETELRAAATGVEDNQRTRADRQLRGRGAIGEPSLLFAGDHFDCDAAALLNRVDEFP
jgi:hypothetical protein